VASSKLILASAVSEQDNLHLG